MPQCALLLCCRLLLVLATVTCGNNRQLQTVTLSPIAADAHNFPNGQVNFAATGNFSKQPSPVQLTSKDAGWCVGTSGGAYASNITTGASVDQNGVAQCVPGIFWNSHSPFGNRRDYIHAGYSFPTQDFRCRAIDLSVTRSL